MTLLDLSFFTTNCHTLHLVSFLSYFVSPPGLLLKPIALEYKEEIFSEFNEEITTYTYPCPAKMIAETELFIKNSIKELKNGTNLLLVVLAKDSGEFLGCAGLHDIDKELRLGIWLKKAAHGNKYGLEAITALKEWAERNLDYEYILYPVDRRNIASKKIPEALGGKVISQYQKVNMSGNLLDTLEYRIYKN